MYSHCVQSCIFYCTYNYKLYIFKNILYYINLYHIIHTICTYSIISTQLIFSVSSICLHPRSPRSLVFEPWKSTDGIPCRLSAFPLGTFDAPNIVGFPGKLWPWTNDAILAQAIQKTMSRAILRALDEQGQLLEHAWTHICKSGLESGSATRLRNITYYVCYMISYVSIYIVLYNIVWYCIRLYKIV